MTARDAKWKTKSPSVGLAGLLGAQDQPINAMSLRYAG